MLGDSITNPAPSNATVVACRKAALPLFRALLQDSAFRLQGLILTGSTLLDTNLVGKVIAALDLDGILAVKMLMHDGSI